jgi:acyl-CoA ligase (AMP-forming) (exosortase A-associated)
MTQLHELILGSAESWPDADALLFKDEKLNYSDLADQLSRIGHFYRDLGLEPGDRVAVYLEKRPETVIALYAASAAGMIFVPINPLLKPAQVLYILRDCNVRLLVTSADRLKLLNEVLPACPDLEHIIVIGKYNDQPLQGKNVHHWDTAPTPGTSLNKTGGDQGLASILYTSGSTGNPKGVVLSHRNMVLGAESVAQYLCNHERDRLLAVLPFSFDYGLSQLSTAFYKGATAVLMNYLLPRDVIRAVARYRITGLAAVPPLWIQLAQLDWPESVHEHLRYLTNSGGAMPQVTLQALRTKLPESEFFLMYGLTEAFRSTYLPPDLINERPGSIGQAIPHAEVLVVREDGSPCEPDEVGELVHTGELVAQGYWQDEEKTRKRFRPAPAHATQTNTNNHAVWSGDHVKRDADGYLYFVGRNDDMIKTSGYRVSPGEVEEVLFENETVGEVAVIGIPHPGLGQAIVVFVSPVANQVCQAEQLIAECRYKLPTFMVPAHIDIRDTLPKNQNGKIDRNLLADSVKNMFQEQSA